jgi:hypothetical protein
MLLPVPSAKPEAVPEVKAAVQLNVAPAVVLVKVIAVVPAVQIVCKVGEAVTIGIGLTVTTTVIGDPEQPFAIGVMV